MVLVEAVPPVEVCPEGWVLFAAVEPLEEDEEEERALVGVPVDKFEPVGEAVVDVLLTVLFWVVSDEDELVLAVEESCVP
jgi:hypothetical protein